MSPKASIGNITQQAAGYCTLRFAGLFNLQTSVHSVYKYGVINPASLCLRDNSTNASNFTTFVLPRRCAPGIVRPTNFSTLRF